MPKSEVKPNIVPIYRVHDGVQIRSANIRLVLNEQEAIDRARDEFDLAVSVSILRFLQNPECVK